MNARRLVRFVLLSMVMGSGTWLIGWWAVPVIGLVAGVAAVAPRDAGIAAGIAWSALLLLDVPHSAFARLIGMLAGVMGLPGALLVVATVVFPIILGWSAASVGTGLRSIRHRDDGVHHTA